MTLVRLMCIAACAATVGGCAFQGVNSLPLPGAVGRGPHASIYHIEIANIGTLESNSPVMMGDVTVGSVGKMRVKGDHADIEISVKPDTAVPANAVATVGQTSLLGSMHVELNPPLGQRPTGQLAPGTTIPLDRSSSYPSTEQTLSALSIVLNSGGLGQIGDIVHNFSTALSGHENDVRELLTRLDEFVGVLDQQRDRIVASHRRVEPARRHVRFAAPGDLGRAAQNTAGAGRSDPRTAALHRRAGQASGLQRHHDPARQRRAGRPGQGSTESRADAARVGRRGTGSRLLLGYIPTFPFTQNFVDRAIRGDYFNVFAVVDMTVPRLKRTIGAGTRWGDPDAPLVPAPGDPWFQSYTRDPLGAGLAPPAPSAPPAPAAAGLATPDMSSIAPLDRPGGG